MTIQHGTHRSIERPLEHAELPGAMLTTTAARALAVLRISTGLVFLWAFLDKTFGLGYATPAERAWINGGSPTKGFLANVEVGPLQSMAHSIAGTWWANTLFMVGLAAIGLALVAGVGLRIAAASGTLMMALMWLAEFPLARFTAGGDPTGSTNPVVDYHLIYAVVLVALAAAYAGHTWGLGRRWARLPFVQRHRWML
ncbi:thiosulfate dehydrogenase [quinone] large subunit [Micromonospora phaseoli]|uniref:Thiosulfate dehydrogenase [quinone] large subunit n=1 Tax=Micromonospora phaseoli TaxID=1144548 RepID=A0A1H6WNQ2_9ACTN|nr:thiosulfate dehydrogenase [quinone] large subunit [Micromonospora phaseoli]GIJ78177.1 membrane protein [Micromonospora phaseoli]SEJ15807.1 thiosulfate dehydrogenase [quinone] large subunit [Micromonospora phaseoli]